MPVSLSEYYERFDESKNYDRLLYRADRTLQSAELNDMQMIAAHRLRGVGDAIFRDGDIIRDCRISINEATGETRCESGAVYLAGAVRGVPPAVITIPVVGTITIGIYLDETAVTELEDPTLYNPAIGTRGEGEPGAARLQVEPAWGYHTGAGEADNFYPIYTVDDGLLRAKEAPPNLDAVTQALARYDRDSAGGTYVVSGLTVLAAADAADGSQVYTVAEGRARVNGYPVELTVSRRLSRAAAPDTLTVDSEPHLAAGAGPQYIDLDRYPVGAILSVRITREVTETVTHGGYTGSQDPLANTSVVEIVSVVQGGVTYAATDDYKLTAGKVDWSPGGLEPAPYSTYDVTYRHIATVAPASADLSGCTVSGAVSGTQVFVTYTQMLPRQDRLCLSKDGEFVWVSGVASDTAPVSPRVPEGMLGIATVHQTWDSSRRVATDGVRVVPMDEIAAINDRIDAVVSQVAQQRLTADLITREAGAKKGLWVDPCLDDEMRDQGIAQTAAITGGAITLPVAVLQVAAMPDDVAAPTTLPYTVQAVLDQPLRTGEMPINPYMAFDPLPAKVRLTPAVDNWTEVQSNWTSAITQIVNGGHYVPTFPGLTLSGVSTSTATQVTRSTTSKLANLRQIQVAFAGDGFGPGEVVDVYFDGILVPTVPATADANGVFAGIFTVPAGVPAGAKQVLFEGRGGTAGAAVFVGQGQLTVQTLRQVITTTLIWHDPLAQTFVLSAPRQIVGVDLWFAAIGSRAVIQLRETSTGVPNQSVLGERIVAAGDVLTNGNATRIMLTAPVMRDADAETALVAMCDDAVSALAIAEIGKWDATYQRWVTSQPYQVGVLQSSSNNNTWTAHQDKDLAFRVLAAHYTAATRAVPLGEVVVADTTDLMVLGVYEQPTASARVEYELALSDGRVIVVSDRQAVRLPEPFTGAVEITAKLYGTEDFSPVLYPGTQLLCGAVALEADYVTRAIPAGADSTCRVILDAYLPAGAGVTCELRADGDPDWTAIPYESSTPLGEGWTELTHEVETDAPLLRCRLVLTGTTLARPFVANPRVLTL